MMAFLTRSDGISSYALFDALEDFDRRAGYRFGWFFYGVHGNRVDHVAVRTIAEAVSSGKIGVSTAERDVLEEWLKVPYGF